MHCWTSDEIVKLKAEHRINNVATPCTTPNEANERHFVVIADLIPPSPCMCIVYRESLETMRRMCFVPNTATRFEFHVVYVLLSNTVKMRLIKVDIFIFIGKLCAMLRVQHFLPFNYLFGESVRMSDMRNVTHFPWPKIMQRNWKSCERWALTDLDRIEINTNFWTYCPSPFNSHDNGSSAHE